MIHALDGGIEALPNNGSWDRVKDMFKTREENAAEIGRSSQFLLLFAVALKLF